ncbi:hypothetical protein EMEDMD4_270234 [Sinorhizobium medicae]|uniref:Uncharacterized protein n=1 Tax=Sinorhizobium medicae TaxID=110321 RepID=A0A508WZR6_9HYPH|nr:hypothetical protein EMEDMD4_270234 [Sinorhizobium medicae]
MGRMLSVIVISLFVQNQLALAGDLHPVDRSVVGNKNLALATEKVAALDDPLGAVDGCRRLRGSFAVGVVRYHGSAGSQAADEAAAASIEPAFIHLVS